ncbi:helix-turn-helix transcriptional regulator [Paucibacter sediminis]|uniref:Helix-turn-helix transcriptional regulator n=1 Tax=Paucibacter sediminis TaxID=3019553 RepID=A0AA95NAG7_9BURK|nr:helix-turn-helix transcriptional regulator [Paucibacter sp. S2-9]WIT10434.1 helix-turn-helix transcriptional regulator [Paucibacter sp. S2-9]
MSPVKPRQTPPRPAPPRARTSVPPLDPLRYAPSMERPVRAKARLMAHHMDIQAHHHDWGQLVFSINGVVRVNTAHATFLVPPSRAVWIPPRVVHAVTAVERCDLRTLYLHGSAGEAGGAQGVWADCRVLEVSPLLRELVLQLAIHPEDPEGPATTPQDQARERCIASLVLDELGRASSLRLGVDLPQDARLRKLCEAVLANPVRHAALADWAAEVGASERTISRLFREQLGSSYAQWRSQALLAHALALAARKRPMSLIAAELGYGSASAFTAMVKRTVGMPPSRFFAEA